jgi:glycine/serine hydroxymethyltransferase
MACAKTTSGSITKSSASHEHKPKMIMAGASAYPA